MHIRPVLIALLALPSGLSSQVIQDCMSCALTATEVAVLGGVDAGPGFVGKPVALAQLPDGRFALGDRYDQDHVKLYRASGDYWGSVGRRGKGPGEYEMVQAIRPLDDGGIEIFDLSQSRVTQLSPDLEVVRTFRVEVAGVWTAVLPDQSRVVMAPLPTPASAGLPLHLLGPDGTWQRSFGADPPLENLQDWDQQIRHISTASDTSVWSAPYLEYALEEWSTSGHLVRRLERQVSWFPHVRQGGFVNAEMPPNPSNRAIHADAAGLVWVITWVADAEWESALEEAKDPYGRNYITYDTANPSRYFDSIVEVIDPEKAAVVGRVRLDAALLGFVNDGLAFGYRTDEDSEPMIPIVRITNPSTSTPSNEGVQR